MLLIAKGQELEQTHKIGHYPVAVKYSYSDRLGSKIPAPHPYSDYEGGPGSREKMGAENLELRGDEWYLLATRSVEWFDCPQVLCI